VCPCNQPPITYSSSSSSVLTALVPDAVTPREGGQDLPKPNTDQVRRTRDGQQQQQRHMGAADLRALYSYSTCGVRL
jgi:hypothetical protein